MILAGDIGGTHTRLALFGESGDPHKVREYSSRQFKGLEQIVAAYLNETGGRFTQAAFGFAGPVEKVKGFAVARGTNVWDVDQRKLARSLGMKPERVGVINDLAANGLGIDVLPPRKFVTLNRGKKQPGNRALVSAGTGLGVGGLLWDDKAQRHYPIASEGGHANLGPRDDLEDGLLKFLRRKDREVFEGNVSRERILSGPGLYNIFDYFRHADIGRQSVEIPDDASPGDAARLVSNAALAGACDRSSQAVDRFVSLYGSVAGDVALMFLALGGVYLGGGIAPKILPKLKEPAFMRSFTEKRPRKLAALLSTLPVHVITDEHTALRGAARYAALELSPTRRKASRTTG